MEVFMSKDSSVFIVKSILAGLNVNSWYSSMNLHVAQGKELTPEIRDALWEEVTQKVSETYQYYLRDDQKTPKKGFFRFF
jgi:hypothetical protein